MYNNINGARKSASSLPPPIPEDVYRLLPGPLASALRLLETDHERDAVLLGSLAVLGACMPNVRARLRDRVYGPALSFCILAPAGSGKGALRWARMIGSKVDAELAAAPTAGITPEAESEGVSRYPGGLFIPANTSAAALLDALHVNGGRGVIFESEIDTITTALGQDWGGFSDVLRAAAEHEPVTVNRKGLYLRLDEPHLSVVLAGTPGQLGRLITSAEDGLFSRFGFLYVEPPLEWLSQQPMAAARDLERAFGVLADVAVDVHRALADRVEPVIVELTPVQWKHLNDRLAPALEDIDEAGVPRSLVASVKRAGVMALRVTMVHRVLRAHEEGVFAGGMPPVLEATDADARAGLEIATTLLAHAGHIAPHLRSTPNPLSTGARGTRPERFLQALPAKFSREEADAVGDALRMSQSTVGRYLRDLVKNGALVHVSHGQYRKP